jgi:hypothetical protein
MVCAQLQQGPQMELNGRFFKDLIEIQIDKAQTPVC